MRVAISSVAGDQTIRLVRREEAEEEQETADFEEDGDEPEPNVQSLVQMLGDGGGRLPGGGGGGGGGGDELLNGEDEADAAAAAAAAAAMAAMEDSDSDDDDMQRKEYVEPKLNRRREIFDMGLHFILILLLYQVMTY
jgi:hypothetical protein